MPSLTLIKIIGDAVFFSHGLKLPVQFQHPQGDPKGKQYSDSWKKPDDLIGVPRLIPPWFMPAETPNKYYQDTCNTIGQSFKDFHDDILDAVSYAHNQWKLQAKFQSWTIMAVSVIGTPGCLKGPELESFIKNSPIAAPWQGNKAKYRDAVAKGVSKCFKNWQDNVTVPGLPMFPAFAAFPGPMAPPMPNVPMPLIACPSPMMSEIITPASMKREMCDALDGGLKDKDPDKHYEALFEAVATVLSISFVMWMAMQQVMLVMGKGQIPTFAPPYVPIGPVVGGDNIPQPGHLMT